MIRKLKDLTAEDWAVLGDVVVDPQGWATRVFNAGHPDHVQAKLDRHRPAYRLRKQIGNYQTRLERDNTAEAAEVAREAAKPKVWAPKAFFHLLTAAERSQVRKTSVTNDAVADWYDDLFLGRTVQANDSGLDVLVTAGVLTQSRMDEILN